MDTNLARIPESRQNAVRVTPVAANAKASHFVTIKRYEGLSLGGFTDAEVRVLNASPVLRVF
jgi:hypothetical protein